MRRAAMLALLVGAAGQLGGCVAAAIPALAASGILGKQVLGSVHGDTPADGGAHAGFSGQQGEVMTPAARPAGDAAAAAAATDAMLGNGHSAPLPSSSASPGLAAIEAMANPSPYAPMVRFALENQRNRAEGASAHSMILSANTDIRAPDYVACSDKPGAVLIDLDEAGITPDATINDHSAAMVAEPGLAADLARLRAAGIAVIWISDAPFEQDRAIYARLNELGLDTSGRDPLYARMIDGDSKAARQQEIAQRYCVLAVAGDSRSDMVEGYDYLRSPELASAINGNWDAGWFVLPAPIHRRLVVDGADRPPHDAPPPPPPPAH